MQDEVQHHSPGSSCFPETAICRVCQPSHRAHHHTTTTRLPRLPLALHSSVTGRRKSSGILFLGSVRVPTAAPSPVFRTRLRCCPSVTGGIWDSVWICLRLVLPAVPSLSSRVFAGPRDGLMLGEPSRDSILPVLFVGSMGKVSVICCFVCCLGVINEGL
jgi:hypothetical protein